MLTRGLDEPDEGPASAPRGASDAARPGAGNSRHLGGQRENPVISRRTRGISYIWILATLPTAAILGAFVHTQRDYLLAFVLVASWLVLPAQVVTVAAWRQARASDRRFWELYGAGLGLMALIGALTLVQALVGLGSWIHLSDPLVLACAASFLAALFDFVRTRSTIRVHILDVLESAMLVIAVFAFVPLAWGTRPIATESLWFTFSSTVAMVGVLAGFCWSLAMFRRVKGRMLPDEKLGMAIGGVCGLNATLQMAQGLSGFALPPSLLLVTQAACFGVVFLTAIQLAQRAPRSYDTLPPHEQTRTRAFDSVAIALLAPLLVITVLLQDQVPWAIWHFTGVAFVLLMLATFRGKLAMREAQRLYSDVETAADARRRLLAEVLQSADHDRHRVAAQLHQQATAFYVAFTSFLRLTDREDVNPSVLGMRDDLERQAEDMRELMLAIRPLEAHADGAANLRSTIAAYVDSLFADTAPLTVDIRIDDDLAIDWATETILMRIIQEALRNVAKHAHASHVIVAIEAEDAGVVLKVLDDGVGFDPRDLLFESGNDYMRNFAAHVGGHVFIESEPGQGTTLRAVLGGPRTPPPRPGVATTTETEGTPIRKAHLRLVPENGESPDDEHAPASRGTQVQVPNQLRSSPLTSVHARLAQRRADSSGRRFFYFKQPASEMVVKDILQISVASFVPLPVAIVAGYTLGNRTNSAVWMLAAITLYTMVLASIAVDLRRLRIGAWDRFDPREVFAQLTGSMLATGAFGIATGGTVATFGIVLIVVLLIGVVVGSRPMIVALWCISSLTAVSVSAITAPHEPFTWPTVLFFVLGSAVIAAIVDLTVSRSRDGLRSLEAVADFTSFACSVRDWNTDSDQALQKVASSVDAKAVVLYERPNRGSHQLTTLARWASTAELSPFVESELRLLSERARSDTGLERGCSTLTRQRLLAIAAPTTSSEIILCVALDTLGSRDDAALIAAVSALASVIDRNGLIEDLLGDALTDPLTGLANRRQLEDFLSYAAGRANRSAEPLTVTMIDLDDFKHFNDRWGHSAGDEVLRSFAKQLRARLRAQDVAGRYGGDEFCLLLPDTEATEAAVVLEDLRAHLADFANEPVTFSAGVAQLVDGESEARLLARADAMLYLAKAEGRDCTLTDDSAATDPLTTN